MERDSSTPAVNNQASSTPGARQPFTRQGPPTFTVPKQSIVCIEHPCIIKNLDNGIRSFGGPAVLSKFLKNEDPNKRIGVSLRPDDMLAKAMPSKQVAVNQLLLKVTAPRRTGRKRKRGSTGPFLAEAEQSDGKTRPTAPDRTIALRTLQDNPDKYKITAVGEIKQSHRFRSLPDYQYATSTNAVMMRARDTLMSDDLDKIKKFRLDGLKGLAKGQDIGPPPYFTLTRQPYNYNYRQNVYVKVFTDEAGATTTKNITAPPKHIKVYIEADAENVPLGPPPNLEPEAELEPRMKEWVGRLRAELEKRPMMQRRVYSNIFQSQNDVELKRAAGYVGYTFTSGPFKDILIKFGVDPRTDPKYRIYQAVAFQIPNEGPSAPDDPGSYMSKRKGKREFFGRKKWVPNTHCFDGTKFYRDGKIWQVCDITDPFLKNVLETAELRSECDMHYSGWYGNGTWSLLRVIMKDKLRAINEGKEPNDQMYRKIAEFFPAFVDTDNVGTTNPDSSGSLGRSNQQGYPVDSQTALLASQVRAMAMAAHRYHIRVGNVVPNTGEKDVSMADVGTKTAPQSEIDAANGDDMEEDDEALIEGDAGSEDDDDEGSDNEDEEEDEQ